MDPARWQRIQAIWFAALDRPLAARGAFLTHACGNDAELKAEVESLLEQIDRDPDFLEAPIVHLDDVLADPASDAASSRYIGAYRLVRPLGEGGMGVVVLAVREGDDFRRTVAIKVIRSGLDTAEILERFRLERRILATLHHTNIAQLLDGGATEDGRPFFVMEYIEGLPIDAYADRHRLTIRQRLELFRTICAAVQHAHQNLVVHRDIKPGNILVTEAGVPKLLDFGIGKVLESDESLGPSIETRTDLRMLTPDYAAPEQVRGEPVSTATDVYALGVLLYELLTGHKPYDLGAGTPLDIERAICTSDPMSPSAAVGRVKSRTKPDGSTETVTPADVSTRRSSDPQRLRRRLVGDLDNVVLMAMRKEPARRYASAALLAEDVRRHLEGLPVSARPDTFRYRAGKFVRRNAGAVIAAAAIVLALLASTAVTLIQSRRVARERDLALEERAKAVEVRGFLLEMFGGTGANHSATDTLTARQLLDLQAATIDESYADQPPLRAEMLQVLAEGYERLGLFPIADTLARNALDLRRELYDSDHPDFAASLNQVGWMQRQLGQLREAVPFLEQAVAMRRNLGESQRLELSRSLNDLGVVLDNLAERERAEPVLREALDIRIALQGPEHRSVGVTANNLATLHYRNGDVAEAMRLQAQALAALRASVGPDHQRSVIAQSNLAVFQSESGALDAAEQTLRDLLERQTRLQGEAHPVTAVVMANLGSTLADRGQNEEAERLLLRSLEIRERMLGLQHRDVSGNLKALARLYATEQRFEEALAARRRVLAIERATLGAEHTSVGTTLVEIARMLEGMGRLDEAEQHYRQAIAVHVESLGNDHPRLTSMSLRLGLFLNNRGQHDEAIPFLSAALAAASARGSTTTANDARILLLEAYTAIGDVAAAEPIWPEIEAARSAGELSEGQLERLQNIESLAARGS